MPLIIQKALAKANRIFLFKKICFFRKIGIAVLAYSLLKGVSQFPIRHGGIASFSPVHFGDTGGFFYKIHLHYL
ncbi:hypothetical protein CSB09_02050 [Candidatus Gracilibacteria bacterium]|nr:MAG: hypothetical protein CSB09_02050 [Candidatus Gracilibacteria bacterium]